MRDKGLVKQNIKLFLEDLLLKDGLYNNVVVGQTDFYFNDISRLQPGDQVYPEPDFIASFPNKVFQSAFKNWVHEDGIPSPGSGIAPPTVASGVTVGGTFFPTATTVGAFAHSIDFPNGRVIFQTPLGKPSCVWSLPWSSIPEPRAREIGNGSPASSKSDQILSFPTSVTDSVKLPSTGNV